MVILAIINSMITNIFIKKYFKEKVQCIDINIIWRLIIIVRKREIIKYIFKSLNIWLLGSSSLQI